MLIILISFFAGILSVLAPCVLPVIPVLFGGWLIDQDNNKSMRIIWSAMLCIFIFTLLLKVSTIFISISQSTRNYVSGIIILFYWLTLFLPRIRELIQIYLPVVQFWKSWSRWWDFLLWASLWPIFTTCSPTYFLLLGAILPVNLWLWLLWLIAYIIGFGWFLYILVIWGRHLIRRFYTVADSHGQIKRFLGLILIITWIFIITGYMKIFESMLIEYWPGFIDLELFLNQFLQ
jgi:cytochrome c-type biogenesis protein